MRTTIDIPEDLHRKLKATAALEGRSMRELVIESLQARLGRRSRGRTRFPIIPSDRKDKFNLTREQVDDAVFG